MSSSEMSSSDLPGDRPSLRAPSRRLLLAVAPALLLAGCLQPVYGGLDGGKLRSELASIKVEPIPDRVGHYLANELIFLLNGSGDEAPARYRLAITVSERVQTSLVNSLSGRATAATVIIDANYKLIPVGSEQPVLSGTAFATVAYDRTSQRFANIRAARDAEIRAAKTLAEQIQVRLASGLSGK